MTAEYKKEIETTEVERLVDVKCNICGLSCRDEMDMNYECIDFGANWGFASHGKDGRIERGHICEKCYDEKITPLFKISPIIKSHWMDELFEEESEEETD